MLIVPAGHKRKSTTLDDFLEAKRATTMFAFKQEFNCLLVQKRQFLSQQRRGSLLVNPPHVSKANPMYRFAEFYQKLSTAALPPEDQAAQLKLIEQVIQESIVIEWPRTVSGLEGESAVEVDMAPLIHRARNVVKCRTSHPTMKIKVYAISNESTDQRAPPLQEAFFRATLVKLTSEGPEQRQIAGRMILTQREGTAATKSPDQVGATVTADGRLLANQIASDARTSVFVDQLQEATLRTTPFKFDNGILCATFPEMGVTLNSMVDRRQLATRYAIQIEVGLNIDSKFLVNHSIISQPFLIAITNDQTEPLLFSIFWSRLTDAETNEAQEPLIDAPLSWEILKLALRNFIKAQVVHARQLFEKELLHLQCMILLSRILRCTSSSAVSALELELYGNLKGLGEKTQLRDRLLTENVLPKTQIDRKEFMQEKCYSILDMRTELPHSPWLWLFRVGEMIQDVGHRLCPSPTTIDKKSSKTKKQMAACEEYQTMLSLFNRGYLSLVSVADTKRIFSHFSHETSSAMLLRFCDENASHLSIAFGGEESISPTFGSLSADQIKDFKQGLPEALIDESYPSKFDCLTKVSQNIQGDIMAKFSKKNVVFSGYRSSRLQNSTVTVYDLETTRVNPLTGEKIDRPPPSTSNLLQNFVGVPQLGQENIFGGLSNPMLSPFFALFQQQISQLRLPQLMSSEGFDVGMLHRAMEETDDRSDDASLEDGSPASATDFLLRSMSDRKQ